MGKILKLGSLDIRVLVFELYDKFHAYSKKSYADVSVKYPISGTNPLPQGPRRSR